ncbi:binding-protein-dependent transport system inner membrane protein [Mycolicibacterium tokaiense]|uniref:Binding-protein-dependent transport system inner membrane protein n=2 Tax=Mycolicibacterium tokaiense TaxID=39695 RepID=A0A378TC21_9MYCO|nr:binding-protein-dependent transport system inner membrane protein [Mycolicibacterium tokaiense]
MSSALSSEPEATVREADALPRRRRGSSMWRSVWPPTAVILMVLAIWEGVVGFGMVNPIILPPPSAIATSLAAMVTEPFFWEAAQATMTETLVGFVIGIVTAWVLGTLLGMSDLARRALYPIVVAFQITPRIAFAPIFLTWFGFGLESKIVMAATICFFPLLLNVLVGMETVDRDARTLMRSFGASRWQEYRELTLPSSLPLILAGIKNAVTLALIGAIVAEFVGASVGMGVLSKTFSFQLDVASSFAVIIALMFFGLLLYGLVELIDKRLVYWRDRS